MATVKINLQIKINAELKSCIYPLTDDEYKMLESQIRRDGCRDPLVLWGDTILDGHNRYGICREHSIEFQTVQAPTWVKCMDTAKEFILQNQLGRRNLPKDRWLVNLGRLYNLRKKNHGGQRGNQYTKVPRSQNATLAKTAEKIAKETGVHPATVYRAAVLAKEVDEYIEEHPEMPDHEAIKEVKAEKRKEEKKPHVTKNTGNNEWYTPPRYIEAALETMGSIELDPASSEIANRTVGAERFYTEDEDGLTKIWKAQTLWMNPPYSQPLVDRFIDKLISSLENGTVRKAMVLTNNATETKFGQKLLDSRHFSAVCFPRGRIKFLDSEGKETGAPLQGQMIILLQSAEKTNVSSALATTTAFSEAFKSIGATLWT